MAVVTTSPQPGIAPARPPRPVVQRRRAFAAVLVAAVLSLLGLGAHGVLTDPGGGPASAAGVGQVNATVKVVAQPGDSLWSIAERHHGDIGLRRYLDALIDLNGGTAIQVGQAVRLP